MVGDSTLGSSCPVGRLNITTTLAFNWYNPEDPCEILYLYHRLNKIYNIALDNCLVLGKSKLQLKLFLLYKIVFNIYFFNLYCCAVFQFKRVEKKICTEFSLDITG